MAPSPYIFIVSIGPVDMNKYARIDEIPSMTLKDIKETKRYGRTDNVKTVYPPTNTVCGGYNEVCTKFHYTRSSRIWEIFDQNFHINYTGVRDRKSEK